MTKLTNVSQTDTKDHNMSKRTTLTFLVSVCALLSLFILILVLARLT